MFIGNIIVVSHYKSCIYLISINYFGRLSYNYKETYLFQFSMRRDGSVRFSKESGRWGNFTSILAGVFQMKISGKEMCAL